MADPAARSIAIVATPEASATGVFSVLDILSSVGRDWEMLQGRPPRRSLFVPRIVAEAHGPMDLINGVAITPHETFEDAGVPDIVIIPDLHIDPRQALPNSFARPSEWITEVFAQGAAVTSVCTALLLAASGLLDGNDATTHWAFCDLLAARHPAVRVRRERVLVPSGEGHRLVTAGGASSWHDLLLYLIARFAGPEEARQIAKLYLLQWHAEGQAPYACLTAGRNPDDRLIAECQVWIADNYRDPRAIAGMVARSGLSERSFLRRFRAATGMSPRDYVQNLRIEEAKHLLETSAMTIDNVASEVGYAEPAGFRAVFRRRVGVSPSAYRRQFSGIAALTGH